MRFISLLLILELCILSSCVEPYHFRIANPAPALVIEASISDVSFNESLEFPSDGRYFQVRLRETSDVINIHDGVVSNAQVTLINNEEEEWSYYEIPQGSGDYYLLDQDFGAELDVKYKLRIALIDGRVYESDWEQIHPSGAEMGSISFEETEKLQYKTISGEKEIVSVKGINLQIELPKHSNDHTVYNRWKLEPTWVYIAPLNNTPFNRICWIQSDDYLSDYTLEENYRGGTRESLAFIETTGNERIYTHLSVLVKQYSLSEQYYHFFKEMKDLSQNKGVFEAPPYNLKSNFICISDEDEEVFGYFGVVEEKAKRWYLSKDQLSYHVEDDLKYNCEVPRFGGIVPPSCTNCLNYVYGTPTDVAPAWWKFDYK